MIEQTLSIIKPDAVERNLENEIKSLEAKCHVLLRKMVNGGTKEKRILLSHSNTQTMIW